MVKMLSWQSCAILVPKFEPTDGFVEQKPDDKRTGANQAGRDAMAELQPPCESI